MTQTTGAYKLLFAHRARSLSGLRPGPKKRPEHEVPTKGRAGQTRNYLSGPDRKKTAHPIATLGVVPQYTKEKVH